MRAARWVVAVACVVVLAPSISACTADSEVCNDVQELRDSVENLQSVRLGEKALDAVLTEVRNIEESLGLLAEDASDEFATEIDAVRDDIEQVRSSAEVAVESPTSASLRSLGDDLRTLRMSVNGLVSAAGDSC